MSGILFSSDIKVITQLAFGFRAINPVRAAKIW
jgi:hypothetical protein